ncbi:MAG: hypothetical protein QW745_08930 [Thermoplasmata archaeon]
MIKEDGPLSHIKAKMIDEIWKKYPSEIKMAVRDLADMGSGKAVQITFNYVKKKITISDVFDVSELNVMDVLIDDSIFLINIDGTIYRVLMYIGKLGTLPLF